ncbi:MAG: endolytic transglycosylase MltG, partial [Alcanivorax sp.]|nr:endolytic transglycosylase MltG [Alcanivorax sp.]
MSMAYSVSDLILIAGAYLLFLFLVAWITEKGWIHAGDYARVARNPPSHLAVPITGPSLEGYLFPETYQVDPERFDERLFIERQVQTFHDHFVEPYAGDLRGRSLHEVVLMASL